MRIVLTREIEELDFINLYKSAGWWMDSYSQDTSFIKKIVDNSFLFAVAFNDLGIAVGMGRVISDSVSDAYIQDVVVLPEYRQLGVGGGIVDLLLEKLEEYGIDWIGLIGEPDTESFYGALGFETLKNYIPMKLKK